MKDKLFKGEPVLNTITGEFGKTEYLWLAEGSLYDEESLAWERLRINRECSVCGELTNSAYKLLCSSCYEKQKIEDYKKLPVEEATEILYSTTFNSYIQTDSIQEFLDNEDEELSIEDLRLVNTTTEELNLVTSIEDSISDFLFGTQHEEDEVTLPDSLIHELEQFATTLPKIYYPDKTKPKL